MSNNKQSTKIAIAFILLANLFMLLVLLNLRSQRIGYTDVAYFNSNFLLLLVPSLLVALALSVFAVNGQLIDFIKKPNMVWPCLIMPAIVLAIVNATISGFSSYLAAFVLWLIFLDIGIGLIAFEKYFADFSIKSILEGLVLMSISFIIILFVLEAGVRAYFNFFGSEADKVSYIYSADKILEKTNRFAGYPYINYGLTRSHPEHNSRGYRGAEIETPKAEGSYRIFTLGGSTTFGDSLQPSETYPAQLQTILQDDYAYASIEVVNAGVNAYSSFDSLANLTYHVLDDEPDMIIIYHGVNDVRARLVDPDSYTGLNLQRGIWSTEQVERVYGGSTLWRFLRIQVGLIDNPLRFETFLSNPSNVVRCPFTQDSYCKPLEREAQDVLDANPPIYFERNLRNMVAIARANGVDVVFSTWAYYAGETPFTNFMSPQHMQNAVDEQNDIIRSLGEELDVPVIDFAETVPEDAAFWIDGMHLTPTGTYEQASEYAAFLVENGLLPQD